MSNQNQLFSILTRSLRFDWWSFPYSKIPVETSFWLTSTKARVHRVEYVWDWVRFFEGLLQYYLQIDATSCSWSSKNFAFSIFSSVWNDLHFAIPLRSLQHSNERTIERSPFPPNQVGSPAFHPPAGSHAGPPARMYRPTSSTSLKLCSVQSVTEEDPTDQCYKQQMPPHIVAKI